MILIQKFICLTYNYLFSVIVHTYITYHNISSVTWCMFQALNNCKSNTTVMNRLEKSYKNAVIV